MGKSMYIKTKEEIFISTSVIYCNFCFKVNLFNHTIFVLRFDYRYVSYSFFTTISIEVFNILFKFSTKNNTKNEIS